MQFINKLLYFSIIALSTSSIIYSAGTFKLAKINNQSATPFTFVLFSGVKNQFYQNHIQSNTTKKIGVELLNHVQLGQMLSFNTNSGQTYQLKFRIAVENGLVILEDHNIKIATNLEDSEKIISKESVDLNYDYSISLVIKTDFKVQMQVIQE